MHGFAVPADQRAELSFDRHVLASTSVVSQLAEHLFSCLDVTQVLLIEEPRSISAEKTAGNVAMAVRKTDVFMFRGSPYSCFATLITPTAIIPRTEIGGR